MALNQTGPQAMAVTQAAARLVLPTGAATLDGSGITSKCNDTPHVRSADLLGGARELVIEHNQREYRLRVTAQGKLILTA